MKRNSPKDESSARPRSACKQRGTCFHYDEHGLWKRDCPVLARQGTAANKTVGVLGTNRAESYSLLVQASVGRQMTQCMVDTGASVSLFPKSFGQNKDMAINHIDSALTLNGVDGNAISICGKVELPVTIEEWTTTPWFLVADIVTGPILGVDFLLKHHATLDLKRK